MLWSEIDGFLEFDGKEVSNGEKEVEQIRASYRDPNLFQKPAAREAQVTGDIEDQQS